LILEISGGSIGYTLDLPFTVIMDQQKIKAYENLKKMELKTVEYSQNNDFLRSFTPYFDDIAKIVGNKIGIYLGHRFLR